MVDLLDPSAPSSRLQTVSTEKFWLLPISFGFRVMEAYLPPGTFSEAELVFFKLFSEVCQRQFLLTWISYRQACVFLKHHAINGFTSGGETSWRSAKESLVLIHSSRKTKMWKSQRV